MKSVLLTILCVMQVLTLGGTVGLVDAEIMIVVVKMPMRYICL